MSQLPIEPPAQDEERPEIVGRQTERLTRPTSYILKKLRPDTFHDQIASRLVGWSMFVLACIWIVTFLTGREDITETIIEIFKMVLTASLGYLFAAHKYNKKGQDQQ